jgi:hypothetical protein
MQAIESRKSKLAFVTSDEVRYRGKLRRVVVEVHRNGVTGDVRLENTRQRYPFSFGGLYNRAVFVAVEKQRLERKAAKGRK